MRTGRRLRRATRIATVVVIGTAAVVATGCTDDSDGTTAATDPAATSTTTAARGPLPALTTTVETAPDLPGYNIYRPADLDATGAPLPVIVWANGGCVRFNGTWAPLLEQWAEAGYFVVAIGPPVDGVTPDGATTDDDQALAIDWALEAERGDGAYAGQLDTDRIVAAGNSCGGITSLQLASRDDRVASVFVLSGSSAGPAATREAARAVMGTVEAPVAFAVGNDEDIAKAAAELDYEVLPAGVPGYIASRFEGDHPTISTDAMILHDVGEISINWFDLSLFGSEAAEKALAENPCACPPDRWSVQHKHLDTLVTP